MFWALCGVKLFQFFVVTFVNFILCPDIYFKGLLTGEKMASYTVDLSPAVVTPVSEGSLDTSVVGGNSIQRTKDALFVVNGGNVKQLYRLADGEVYDDTTFATVVHNLPAGNPYFASGNPVVVGNNVTIGHPTARSDSGSTV
jgi:hypothetical protein